MSYLPILSFRELKKILNKLGYNAVRQNGSHVIFANRDRCTIVVPNHKGRKMGKGLLRKLINDLNISVKEFIKLANNK